MAIINRRRFRRDSYSEWQSSEWQSDDLVICGYGLAELFDVPADLREIWITLRDRKTVSSRRMQIDLELGATLVESGTRHYLLWSASKYLQRLYERGIKTIYVEVEYEE